MLQQLLARRHRIAPQQVGDVDLLDIVDAYPAVGQIDESRNAAHVQRIWLEQAEDFTATRP
ncbi:hypothetical protein D3C78_1709010 [compost metagenome]